MISHLLDRLKGTVPKGHARSKDWGKVRKAFLAKNPTCALCGGTNRLQVHHITPFHVDPSKELDEANLIALCESKKHGVNCHLWFGHLGDFHRDNPTVTVDAQVWKGKRK